MAVINGITGQRDLLKSLETTPSLVRAWEVFLHCVEERRSTHLQVVERWARHVQQRSCDCLADELEGSSKCLVQA